MSLDGKTFISATEGWDPKQQGKWALKKNPEVQKLPFSREAFQEEFDAIDAEHTRNDDRGSVDLTAWIQHRAKNLLNMLNSSPEHYSLMEKAIASASPGEVLRIARQILEETS